MSCSACGAKEGEYHNPACPRISAETREYLLHCTAMNHLVRCGLSPNDIRWLYANGILVLPQPPTTPNQPVHQDLGRVQ